MNLFVKSFLGLIVAPALVLPSVASAGPGIQDTFLWHAEGIVACYQKIGKVTEAVGQQFSYDETGDCDQDGPSELSAWSLRPEPAEIKSNLRAFQPSGDSSTPTIGFYKGSVSFKDPGRGYCGFELELDISGEDILAYARKFKCQPAAEDQ